jgi:hypothetical protein
VKSNAIAKSIEAREKALESFDLSFVLERLISDGKLQIAELPKIDAEFRKFFKLVLSGTRPLAMIDRRVDEFWHAFVLFTPQYRVFCEKIMGFFVDHQPRTKYTPVPPSAISNFVEDYKIKFGELDSFWLQTLDDDLRVTIESGVIPNELSFDWSGWTGPSGVLDSHF